VYCTTSFKEIPSSHIHLDNQVAELDWSIQKLQERRREVVVLRNSLAPIARLPSETLIHIFWLCVESEREADLHSMDFLPFLCYTWISHICHAWRKVAFDTPLLWTHPLFSCPEIAEAMTTRAMDLPLTINCGLDDISLSSVIPILQARPIHSLSLVGVARC
jgi:hypothetical protein